MILVDPAPTAVTTPVVAFTDAILVEGLTQTPPVGPLKVVVNVGQMLLFPVIVPDVEAVTTVTVTVAVTAQPLLPVLV